MKSSYLRTHGRSGIELIEESFVLLRTAPLSAVATYYTGSVPFAAGFLFFCSDLSRHPRALEHLGPATLALTVLFVWMKFFHARFGNLLMARLQGNAPPAWMPGDTLRSLALQTIIQSSALILLPVATIAVLPFGWVYAFYQNVSALDDGRTPRRELVRSALGQSLLWPGQNHVFLMVISTFGLIVCLDWLTLGFFAPQLLKMFLGIETAFTRSIWSLLNTTFLAAVGVMTYLSVDPLIKAFYVLRCFYGKSVTTGDDLRTDLRRLRKSAGALACLLLCFAAPLSQAAEAAPRPAVTAAELDRSIATVIGQEKYAWRNPAPADPRHKDGLLEGFVKSISATLKKAVKAVMDFMERMSRWMRPRRNSMDDTTSSGGWPIAPNVLLYSLMGLVACALIIAFLRGARNRRRPATALEAAPAGALDVESEETTADQLPEDDWTRLGRRLWEQGELRLALRAFYLGGLARLAAGGIITIVRSKSNRDYEREIRRRGHAYPGLCALFSENVGVFDRVWYGRHEVTPDLLRHFVSNLEKMKTAA